MLILKKVKNILRNDFDQILNHIKNELHLSILKRIDNETHSKVAP